MGINLEKRLTSLENELKALKGTYTIYGGAVKMYVSTSELFDVPPDIDEASNMKIKFTSSFEKEKNILIAMVTETLYTGSGTVIGNSDWVQFSIQSRNGSVIISPAPTLDTKRLRLTVYANSPGTFTRIQ